MKWSSYTLDLGLMFSRFRNRHKDNFLLLCNCRVSVIAYTVEENHPLNKSEHLAPIQICMYAWTWEFVGIDELSGVPWAGVGSSEFICFSLSDNSVTNSNIQQMIPVAYYRSGLCYILLGGTELTQSHMSRFVCRKVESFSVSFRNTYLLSSTCPPLDLVPKPCSPSVLNRALWRNKINGLYIERYDKEDKKMQLFE